jgi:hypothetical protein
LLAGRKRCGREIMVKFLYTYAVFSMVLLGWLMVRTEEKPEVQFSGTCYTDEWCDAYTKIDELQRKYQDLYDLCTERRIVLRCHDWVVERMEK